MLKRVLVVIRVIIVIVGVRKKIIPPAENERGTDVGSGQEGIFRISYLKDLFAVIIHGSAALVTEIRGRVPVPDYFHRVLNPYRSVISRDDQLDLLLR